MTNEELFNQGPPKILDNTMRTDWRLCPRRFYWNSRGYTYKGKPIYFTSGSAWHLFIERYYTYLPSEPQALAAIAAIHEAKTFYRDNSIGDIEVPKTDAWENLEQLMRLYAETYPAESWILLSGETGWLWPIHPELMYGGSLDGYIEWPGYGILAIENKTVGMYLNESYVNQWSFAPQITGILWGLEGLLGKQPFGCLMNLASKQPRSPKSKATTPQFTRRLEKRTSVQLKEFTNEVIRDHNDLKKEWERWVWPRTVNPIECAGGIGRKRCLYADLCLTPLPFTEIDPLTTANHIALRDKPWEPWKRKGGQEE